MSNRYTKTPEEKADAFKLEFPKNYIQVVDGIIESLEFNDPGGYGEYEEEIRKQIQEDLEYYNKVKQILETPKDISYFNETIY